KQLQYSWLRAITGDHTDFWTVTQDGLDWALESEGLDGDVALRDRLLALYWQLSAFPEVPGMLSALKAAGMNTAILSNGSPEMLSGAVQSAGLGEVLDDVLSVESVGIFKPAPQVYDMVIQRFGCAKSHVLFVSSNGWDAGAAAAYGFRTVWVNRAGDPVDRLPGRPDHILRDLTAIPDLVTR
ncbi:MAG: haloacid dehalogenase type II, partial [Paracoccaceae bacterium]